MSRRRRGEISVKESFPAGLGAIFVRPGEDFPYR